MSLIVASRCVRGEEEYVELALREALSNAMLHGNRSDARKLVHVRCCCESGKGVFDPNKTPDPLVFENLRSEHGRGIHLMKLAMDEISFQREGTEVHMRKSSGRKQETPARRPHGKVARRHVSRPSPGVRVVELCRRPAHAASQMRGPD
jgi:serine/threonine-protein kinase RsbW